MIFFCILSYFKHRIIDHLTNSSLSSFSTTVKSTDSTAATTIHLQISYATATTSVPGKYHCCCNIKYPGGISERHQSYPGGLNTMASPGRIFSQIMTRMSRLLGGFFSRRLRIYGALPRIFQSQMLKKCRNKFFFNPSRYYLIPH